MDTHTDTCCAIADWQLLDFTNKVCKVTTFSDSYVATSKGGNGLPYVELVPTPSCTMAPAFLSPGGVVSTQGANQGSGAAFASGATHPGKNFMLSGSNLVMNEQKLKVAILFTADDKVNPTPALSMLLKTCKYLDTNTRLKSNDPLFSSIENVDDLTKITNIEKYVSDLQTNVQKRQFVYFVTLETTVSFLELKYNKAMFSWLRENQHYIWPHSMNTNYVTPIGWFSGLHPTLSSRDNMKVLLAKPLDSIEYTLVTASTFFIDKDGKKVNTNVVEIHVASESADRAREHCRLPGKMRPFLPNLKAAPMDSLSCLSPASNMESCLSKLTAKPLVSSMSKPKIRSLSPLKQLQA
jgi:hypothetical protein